MLRGRLSRRYDRPGSNGVGACADRLLPRRRGGRRPVLPAGRCSVSGLLERGRTDRREQGLCQLPRIGADRLHTRYRPAGRDTALHGNFSGLRVRTQWDRNGCRRPVARIARSRDCRIIGRARRRRPMATHPGGAAGIVGAMGCGALAPAFRGRVTTPWLLAAFLVGTAMSWPPLAALVVCPLAGAVIGAIFSALFVAVGASRTDRARQRDPELGHERRPRRLRHRDILRRVDRLRTEFTCSPCR